MDCALYAMGTIVNYSCLYFETKNKMKNLYIFRKKEDESSHLKRCVEEQNILYIHQKKGIRLDNKMTPFSII